jgi:hypothetical protein
MDIDWNAEVVDQLETHWKRHLRGPAMPPEYADTPLAKFFLFINMEVIHHGAEVCLLRDLYQGKAAEPIGQ